MIRYESYRAMVEETLPKHVDECRQTEEEFAKAI
jgi:hypothetical protein